MDKKTKIDELLEDKSSLMSKILYKRDIEFIKKILQMEEWKNPKLQGLLTTNIWFSNALAIEKILKILD